MSQTPAFKNISILTTRWYFCPLATFDTGYFFLHGYWCKRLKIKAYCSEHCGQLFQTGKTEGFMTQESGVPRGLVCFFFHSSLQDFLKTFHLLLTLQYIYSLVFLGFCGYLPCTCPTHREVSQHTPVRSLTQT